MPRWHRELAQGRSPHAFLFISVGPTVPSRASVREVPTQSRCRVGTGNSHRDGPPTPFYLFASGPPSLRGPPFGKCPHSLDAALAPGTRTGTVPPRLSIYSRLPTVPVSISNLEFPMNAVKCGFPIRKPAIRPDRRQCRVTIEDSTFEIRDSRFENLIFHRDGPISPETTRSLPLPVLFLGRLPELRK